MYIIEYKLSGNEMVRKKATKHGNSSYVYLPKAWAGKEVVVILVE